MRGVWLTGVAGRYMADKRHANNTIAGRYVTNEARMTKRDAHD